LKFEDIIFETSLYVFIPYEA